MANSANSLSHTKWMCKYHIVIVPKYRREVIYNQKQKDLQEIIRTLNRIILCHTFKQGFEQYDLRTG